MDKNKCLYLICSPDKWFGEKHEKNYQVNDILKNLETEDWGIHNLKDIYVGMQGIIKVSVDKRLKKLLDSHGIERLESGIYATFEVAKITFSKNNNRVNIQIINNFFKNDNLITKEKSKEILGNKFDAQSQGYISKETYEIITNYKNTIFYPDEILEEDGVKIYEGAKRKILVNAYERNPKARKKCIEKYGYNCYVCDFNFEEKYRELGKDFIHVHHLIPLHKIKEEYIVNPIDDLIPVCPNCHAMLHRNNSITIEELKDILNVL